MSVDVTLGGVPLESLGVVGDVEWSTAWGPGACGSSTAACTVELDRANDTRLVRLARELTIDCDGLRVFAGRSSEVGRGVPRSLTAKGWGNRFGDFDAVDGSGNPTTNPATAMASAIADGIEVTDPSNAFASTSLGVDGEPTTTRCSTLFDQVTVTLGNRWGVDDYRRLFTAEDPTDPVLYLDASDLDLGVADDGLFSMVRARFVTGVDPDNKPISWSSVEVGDDAAIEEFGAIWYPMDLTKLGQLSAPTATAYATQQLALLTVPQWISRVTTTSSRLLDRNGNPAYLPGVRAGQMVELFNVPHTLGGLMSRFGLRYVLGETSFKVAAPTEITIAPVGLAVRNLADALAEKAAA